MPEFITIGPDLVEIPVAVRADGDEAVRAFVATRAPKAAPQTPDRAPTGEEK